MAETPKQLSPFAADETSRTPSQNLLVLLLTQPASRYHTPITQRKVEHSTDVLALLGINSANHPRQSESFSCSHESFGSEQISHEGPRMGLQRLEPSQAVRPRIPKTPRKAAATQNFSVRKHAECLAGDIVGEYRLSQEFLPILADILTRRSYGNIKSEVIELIKSGASADEVLLSHQIRQYWQEVWQEAEKSKRDKKARDRSLSWINAFCIVKAFEGCPSLDEIHACLEQYFQKWYELDGLHESKDFLTYFLRAVEHYGEWGIL